MREIGPNARRWKGDQAGYVAKHIWVRKHFKLPFHCAMCRKGMSQVSRLEWANISGKYFRVRKDWIVLCPPCHRIFDAKSHCKNGHEYTPENTKRNTMGHRQCRVCLSLIRKRYKHAKRN